MANFEYLIINQFPGNDSPSWWFWRMIPPSIGQRTPLVRFSWLGCY